MTGPEIREIAYGSDLYRDTLALRDEILRKPLGLTLAPDAGEERAAYHAGAFRAGRLIGCAMAIREEGGIALLRQMAVAQGSQREGVGSAILAHIEAWARANRIAQIRMKARVAARGFYEKHGYAAQGEAFLSVSIPHIVMRKSL